MGVQFLLVSFLQTKDHLARHDTFLGALELQVRVERDLCGIFVDVGGDLTLVDVVLCNTLLETAHGSNRVQRTRMNFATTICDDTYYNLLPSVLTPGSRLHTRAEVADVLHDSMHGSCKVELIFV